MSPLIAVSDGTRVTVTAGGPNIAQCPGCGHDMRAKRGTIITHHWAHLPDPNHKCTTEPETAWHLDWKNRGDVGRIEVAVAPSFIQITPDTLLLMGKWYDKKPNRPLMGYGWPLTADEFTEHVINGAQQPRPPEFGKLLDPSRWSVRPDLSDELSTHLRDVIAAFGGKCATCGRFICACLSALNPAEAP